MVHDGSDFPATTSRRQMLGLLGAGLLAPAAALALPGTARASSVTPRGDVVINPSSFANYRLFERSWNYLYPWGSDHNGSARMFGSPTDHSHISLSGGVLT